MEKQKILIVEDDRTLVDILKEAFEPDYQTVIAGDSSSAMAKIKRDAPDLILLDILLPGKSGFEFLAEIKNDNEIKNIPVIILSNLGQDTEIKKGMSLGAIDYLVKSDFTIDEVIKKAKKAITK
ncbi:response regulator [Candidatus Parcubacteria bacterium]|nr:MAG: response regulator [Candidatus Parcubacteria bacterium]